MPRDAIADVTERYRLDNGLTVLLRPHPGGGTVAVSSFYRAGFFHEPEGKAHLSHVVEHMVLQSGTKNYAPRQAFQALRQRGMAIAEIPRRDLPPTAAWRLDGDARVEWDLGSDAVYLVYLADERSEDERIVLTLFGNYLSGILYGHAGLRRVATAAFCSNQLYPVGEAPFFAFAQAHQGQDIDLVRDSLVAAVRQSLGDFDEAVFGQLRSGTAMFMEQSLLGLQAARTGLTPEMLLGQEAINLGIKELLRDGTPPEAFLERLNGIDFAQASRIVTERLSDDARDFVTFITDKP